MLDIMSLDYDTHIHSIIYNIMNFQVKKLGLHCIMIESFISTKNENRIKFRVLVSKDDPRDIQ